MLRPYLGYGWAAATAVAPFEAEAEGELSFDAGTTLLVSGDDPAAPGWAVACAAEDTARRGLAPRDFLLLHDVAVTAAAAHVATSPGELSFAAGDELAVRPGAPLGASWWLARAGGRSRVQVPSLAGQSSPSPPPHMEAFGSRLLYTLWRSHGATRLALRG